MIVSKRQVIFVLFLLFSLLCSTVHANQPDKSDTRILIDISGSMKQNDPNNLRRSALRLLVGLMSPENRAGVWTFAQYSNMLVPLGVINDSWKKKARRVSEKISSPGQFTNIEAVMLDSTADWDAPSNDYRRNIILLTDGMVDVSKDAARNTESRQKILQEIAPAIKQTGAQIHTIALSDRADHELMKNLSEMTGGWYEQVNSADELQRVFLRMFEKVGKPDSVPLSGNKFQLDESIEEATLLLFSADNLDSTKIMSPGGDVFDADNLPENVSWHQDVGYDLITITRPAAGEWTIDAKMDPDNRVMVVTNLKMVTSDIPNRLAVGESVPVEVYFTEKGKPISEKQFIKVVQVSASQLIEGEESEAQPLQDDGNSPDEKAGDGYFSVAMGEGLQAGTVELIINADGKTFVRERRQLTQIVPPVSFKLEDNALVTSANFQIKTDNDVVEESSLTVKASLEDASGNKTDLEFMRNSDGIYEMDVDKQQLQGPHVVMINVSGKTKSGNTFNFQPQQVDIEGMAEPPQPEPAPEPVIEPPASSPVAEEPETDQQTQFEPETEAEEETNWVMLGLMVGLGNLLLIGAGIGAWFFLKKRSAGEEDLFVDEENESQAKQEEQKDKADKKASDDAIDISAGDNK